MGKLTCGSCANYRRKSVGYEFVHKCDKGRSELVPFATPFDCEEFEYEPGSDEEELSDELRRG